MEVEREALFFQVDVLQDTLEGVEELLAEAQREAGQANSVCCVLTNIQQHFSPQTVTKLETNNLLVLA